MSGHDTGPGSVHASTGMGPSTMGAGHGHDRPRPRRRGLRIVALMAALGTLALSLPVGGIVFVYSRAVQSNVGELTFGQPLKVPPLLEPEIDDQGRKVFDLRFQAGTTELIEGRSSRTWGLNGTYLGPTLRAERGDEVLVNVDNGVDEMTTLHWHGMHLPAAMDGGPHQMIAPGERWSPTWTIDQPAASLWYHPHLHGQTAEHVYRGAAGMFILDDAESKALDLPDTYGVDDIPLIIQDKKIDGDGDLRMEVPFMGQVGLLGDEILVNGTHDPHVEVTTELVRFRVLNGSNGRIYNLGFDDDAPFWQIASDSGLLEAPHETRRLQLSPGERAEIVVAVEPGERAVLRSHEPDLGANFWGERFGGGDDTFDLVEVRGADELDPSPAMPDRLVDLDRPDPDEVVATRSFRLSGNRINGRAMDMDRIDHVVPVGSIEIWELRNTDGAPHSFHPHLVHFTVLDIGGSPPPPPLAGWKDTIYLPPETAVRIIARFDDHADPDTPFMFHCHVLLHEDEGMMGQYTVE